MEASLTCAAERLEHLEFSGQRLNSLSIEFRTSEISRNSRRECKDLSLPSPENRLPTRSSIGFHRMTLAICKI